MRRVGRERGRCVRAGQWAKAGLVLTLVSGCITTPRSRQVTDLYRDAGDGLRLTASVKQESAQQFRYRLSPLAGD